MTDAKTVMNVGCMVLFVASMAGCATLREVPRPVRVPEIVELSKGGMPADEIIAKMRASGTVYRMTASQLADLQQQGVAGAVVDYMQQTYIDAVKRDAAYGEWRHWSRYHDYWYGGVPYGWPYERVYIIRESGHGRRGNHRFR